MWTKPAVAAMQRAQALYRKWDKALATLEEMAKHAPIFAERIAQQRAILESLNQIATIGLTVDSEGEDK